MSRHDVPSPVPHLACVVGWDPTRATFFAQVFDLRAEVPDEPVVWIGEHGYATVAYPDDLASRLSPWVHLPDTLVHRLEEDRRRTPPWPRSTRTSPEDDDPADGDDPSDDPATRAHHESRTGRSAAGPHPETPGRC